MKVIIVKNYEEASQEAAKIFINQVKENPQSILGLATGSTPIRMYELLREDHEKNHTSYKDVKSYNLDEYFGLDTLKVIVRQPLAATETADKFDVLVNVRGGGTTGQAGAIRHGIARALCQADADYRPVLKKAGFLTRDPRMKERKKYGLKAARRAPQFSKR